MRKKGIISGILVFCFGLVVVLAGCNAGGPHEKKLSDTVIKRVVINASPEQVWAYMFVEAVSVDDTGTQKVEWIPEWRCSPKQGAEKSTRTCKSTLEVAGKEFQQDFVVVEEIPNQKFAQVNVGDINDTGTYLLYPYENGTELIVHWKYSLYLPEGVTREAMTQGMEKIMDSALKRIKSNVESKPASAEAMNAVAAAQEVSSLSDTGMVSVVINAPVEKVFAYMTDPARSSEWSWSSASNVKGQGLGQTSDWEVEVGGMAFRGQGVTVEYVPNQKVVENFWGDVHGSNTWLYLPEGEGTKVILIQTASLSTAGMARKDWEGLVQANMQSLQKALQKAKEMLEK